MKKRYLKPWIFGVITASLFVISEAVFKLYPPNAYTFCLSCHTRDLINTIVNIIFNTKYQTTFIARRALMLTSQGVIAGAFIAALIFKERRVIKSGHPLVFFSYGFLVMIAGIVVFGCPTRIIIRSGYGDVYGIIALFGMFIGIWNGTSIIRHLAKNRGMDLE